MNLFSRAGALRTNLERYNATDLCPGPIAQTYAVILQEAKKEFAEDPIISTLPEPQQEEGNATLPGGSEYLDCGTVLTWVMQIQSAVSERGRESRRGR